MGPAAVTRLNMKTNTHFRLTAVLAGAVAVVLNHGAAYAQDPMKGFDDFANQALADWQVPGMAIAVVKDSKVVLARGYGVCKLRPEKGPEKGGRKRGQGR